MSEEAESPSKIRLAKIIASRGIASRRAAEDLIREGRVQVNGRPVTEVATLVDPFVDKVRVDGQGLPAELKKVYYVVFKPKGVLTSRDEEKSRLSVMHLVENFDLKGCEPIGRLEVNTEGAILLTNDGDLANALSKRSVEVPQRFMVKVYRTPNDRAIKAIERGFVTQDEKFAPAKIRITDQTDTDNAWLEVTLTAGGGRTVQRMFAALGHPVSKLRRESYATISIHGMERGTVRELTPQEVARLRDIAAGVKPQKAGKSWRGAGFAKPKPRAATKSKRRV